MTDAPGDNGNGKVTLAILGAKMDETNRRLDRIETCFEVMKGRQNEFEKGQAQRVEQIHTLREDVDNLEKKSDGWNIINSAGVAVAALFAFLRGQP